MSTINHPNRLPLINDMRKAIKDRGSMTSNEYPIVIHGFYVGDFFYYIQYRELDHTVEGNLTGKKQYSLFNDKGCLLTFYLAITPHAANLYKETESEPVPSECVDQLLFSAILTAVNYRVSALYHLPEQNEQDLLPIAIHKMGGKRLGSILKIDLHAKEEPVALLRMKRDVCDKLIMDFIEDQSEFSRHQYLLAGFFWYRIIPYCIVLEQDINECDPNDKTTSILLVIGEKGVLKIVCRPPSVEFADLVLDFYSGDNLPKGAIYPVIDKALCVALHNNPQMITCVNVDGETWDLTIREVFEDYGFVYSHTRRTLQLVLEESTPSKRNIHS